MKAGAVSEDIGDRYYFVGWRLFANNSQAWVRLRDHVQVTVIDVDCLSNAGSYPDRYTIRFDDGFEMDCCSNCLRKIK